MAAGRPPLVAGRRDQQHTRLAVRQHRGLALARVGRVDRHVGAAGLHDAQQSHQHFNRLLDADTNRYLRPNAQPAQVTRELVGASA